MCKQSEFQFEDVTETRTYNWKKCNICGKLFHPENMDLMNNHMKKHMDDKKPKTKYFAFRVTFNIMTGSVVFQKAWEMEGVDVRFFEVDGSLFDEDDFDIETYDDGGVESMSGNADFYVKIPDMSAESVCKAISLIKDRIEFLLDDLKNEFVRKLENQIAAKRISSC